jgi:hypothetical protein
MNTAAKTPQAKGQKPKAKSQRPKAKRQKPKAKSQLLTADCPAEDRSLRAPRNKNPITFLESLIFERDPELRSYGRQAAIPCPESRLRHQQRRREKMNVDVANSL